MDNPPRHIMNVHRKFEAGKTYRSSDGSLVAVVGAVRRGKHSTRILAELDNSWGWHEVGISGGCEVFFAETVRGVFVIPASRGEYGR